jgi:prevent-host-death family protein
MRPVAVTELQTDTTAVLDRAQRERVVITRSGKPCAIVIGVENYDVEDFDLARSADFWRLIEARRQGPMIPLAEVKRRLANTRARNGKPKRRKT